MGARAGGDPYDVAVVGAGPAGAAAATHLARAGWRVVVLDRARFPRDKPCAEFLSPAAVPLLRELGVWDELAATGPARLRGIIVYPPDGRPFRAEFAGARARSGGSGVADGPQFTWGPVLPRLVLDDVLVRSCRAAGAAVHEGWTVGGLARSADGQWRLERAGHPEDRVVARLLIAADGIHSTVVRRLGLFEPGILRKIALVAHVRGIDGLRPFAEMHVAGRRYVGLAPIDGAIADGRCNVAMVVDEARDGTRLAGHTEQFLLESLESFPGVRGRLGRAAVVRPTLAASRLDGRARHVTGDGLLIIGDAAGYYDPFTGEGIYHALHSARVASEAATQGLLAGDLGRPALARYAAQMRASMRGRRTIEQIIQTGVQVPAVMNHLGSVLRRRQWMADTVVGVTGDYLPASEVLRPGYLLRLLV